MARTTKAALEAQVAELLLTVGAMRTRIVDLEVHAADIEGELKFSQARVSELEAELEAHRAPAPAPKPPIQRDAQEWMADRLAARDASKAAAQAAAKDAAMSSKRCTRVVQLHTGEYTWEYYGKKAA